MHDKRVKRRCPEPLDWSTLVALLVHPTKVQIVEAMWWIDRPLSASELEEVFGGKHSVPALSYHITTLARFGVLTQVEKLRVRGTWKRLYVFTSAVKLPRQS